MRKGWRMSRLGWAGDLEEGVSKGFLKGGVSMGGEGFGGSGERLTRSMAAPRMKTRFWSAMVVGEVRR